MAACQGISEKRLKGKAASPILHSRFPRSRTFRRLASAAIIATILLLLIHFRSNPVDNNVEETILRYLSLSSEEEAKLRAQQLASMQEGLRQCAFISQEPVSMADERRINPRAVTSAPSILLKNATLIDGDGSIVREISILLAEGVIKEIGRELDGLQNVKLIDVGGRYVSPGLIDMVI